jgi:hypothetical protein
MHNSRVAAVAPAQSRSGVKTCVQKVSQDHLSMQAIFLFSSQLDLGAKPAVQFW